MDRHDLPGVTAKDVAEAHQADLNIQHEYGCRGLTYWFDEIRGIAFCLVEAPDKGAVERMHNHAHGLIPHQIVEVDNRMVETFLGWIEEVESLPDKDRTVNGRTGISAYRIILATELFTSNLAVRRNGHTGARGPMQTFLEIVRNTVRDHGGSNVDPTDDIHLTSFVSVKDALNCALSIQKCCRVQLSGCEFLPGMGISAGHPVTMGHDFFEEAIIQAKRLSRLAGRNVVMISAEVSELAMRENVSVAGEVGIRLLNSGDENFLKRITDILEGCWSDSRLTVPGFCRKIGLSKSQLNRRLSALTGFSPNEFIREFRLIQALGMIEKREGNISEIAYGTGFSSPSYFSHCFENRFGLRPSILFSESA